jgi:hypothetical protein
MPRIVRMGGDEKSQEGGLKFCLTLKSENNGQFKTMKSRKKRVAESVRTKERSLDVRICYCNALFDKLLYDHWESYSIFPHKIELVQHFSVICNIIKMYGNQGIS